MPVTRIVQIREHGVFHDYQWSPDLPDFARYNVIYGWNGSGKTTISRILRALELRTSPSAGTATLQLDTRNVPEHSFQKEQTPVRVFNRDFIEESVFPTGGGDIPPIFVLGKDNVEKQKNIDHLRTHLNTIHNAEVTAAEQLKSVNRQFDKFCEDRARLVKEKLRSAGASPYNYYNKSKFQEAAEQMALDGTIALHQLDNTTHDALMTQHNATAKDTITEVKYTAPNFEGIAQAAAKLVSETVVSNVIQTLKDDPERSEWTRKGLELHRQRKTEQCLFCEQPIPPDRMRELEGHFSRAYEQFLRNLQHQIEQVETTSRNLTTLTLPNRAQLYDHLQSDYQSAETIFRDTVATMISFLKDLIRALGDKKTKAFEVLDLDIPVPPVKRDAIDRLNALIREHNSACADFRSRAEEARKRIALSIVASQLGEFLHLKAEISLAKTAVDYAKEQSEEITRKIEELERDIAEHLRPAEELTADLRSYLGHDEFTLSVKDTGYTIMRGNRPAISLSEGEMTAIALLYFLKSLQDRAFELSKGVVVLDDPVSSLDANALYLAFGFIRERTKDAGQLVILTHNFSFFRQIRNWFHHLKGQNKSNPDLQPARFYMLECTFYGKIRHSQIRKLDPLLEKYESEYHYLFSRVYRASIAPAGSPLEAAYALPNMARRLLEAFLAFRRPQSKDKLWEKLQSIQFDEGKKLRIYRFLNTFSHSDGVAEPEHDLSSLAEGRIVLQNLMELMSSEDDAHCSAMVELVTDAVPLSSATEPR